MREQKFRSVGDTLGPNTFNTAPFAGPLMKMLEAMTAIPALLKTPELLRTAEAPPVRRTLDAIVVTPALLKLPALDKKPPAAVIVRLLATIVA